MPDDLSGDKTSMLDSLLSTKGILLSSLGTAAASGGLGAYMASREPQNPGESEEERRKRILSTALKTSLLGGGAAGVTLGGLSMFGNSSPPRSELGSSLAEMEMMPRGVIGGIGGAGIGALIGGGEAVAKGKYIGKRPYLAPGYVHPTTAGTLPLGQKELSQMVATKGLPAWAKSKTPFGSRMKWGGGIGAILGLVAPELIGYGGRQVARFTE